MADILNLLRAGTSRKKAPAPSACGSGEQHPLFIDNYRPISSADSTSGMGLANKETGTKKTKVRVSGLENPPAPMTEFGECSVLAPWIWKTMKALNYSEPTPVQSHAIPVLCNGHDLIATAPTGSGKTLSFLLPVFQLLQNPGKSGLRALVVDPTRELAQQTVRESERFVGACSRKFTIRLLEGFNASSSKKVDVGVAAPLRLLQLLREGTLSLTQTRIVILDEADKLLDLGFQPQIDELLGFYRAEVERRREAGDSLPLQLCFVSATLPDKVVSLAEAAMVAPVRITIGHQQAANVNVTQRLLFVGKEEGKLSAFRQLIREGGVRPPTLVFVQSKERAKELCAELLFDGVMVDAIHAERTRTERDKIVAAFRAGKVWVLVCTDVMARGVDFKGVEMVINYDVPQTAETYIHRIGRTGRAGRKGEAVTFFTEEDIHEMRGVVNVIRNSGFEVPDWLSKAVPKRTKRGEDVKHREFSKTVKRQRIDTTSGYDRAKLRRKEQIKEMQKSKEDREQN